MKKGRFAGLVYRELYLCRKNIIINLVIFAGFAAFGLMLLLSFYYGNIGKILSWILVDGRGNMFPDAQETYERMRSGLFSTMKLTPVVMTMGIAITTTDIAAKDTMTAWHRYVHCTPVTPLRYAAVKTTVNVIMVAASFVLGVLYMFIIGIISGESITYRDTSLLVFILMILTVFGVIGQTFILLLGNRDKGMLASMGVLIAAGWVMAYCSKDGNAQTEGIGAIIEAAETLLPYSPLILAGLFALLFAALYFIYRRREK